MDKFDLDKLKLLIEKVVVYEEDKVEIVWKVVRGVMYIQNYAGLEVALLAPTVMNQQKFMFERNTN